MKIVILVFILLLTSCIPTYDVMIILDNNGQFPNDTLYLYDLKTPILPIE